MLDAGEVLVPGFRKARAHARLDRGAAPVQGRARVRAPRPTPGT